MPTTATNAPGRAAALPPEERRAAIVEAIGPMLVEHGERLTTRQIAEAAGVAEGTIFRVFVDKEALLFAALDAALDMADLEQSIREIDRALSFDQQLVAATQAIQHRVEHVWRLVSNLGPTFQRRAARPLTDSDALTELFAAQGDQLNVAPDVAARMLRALTLSMTHPMLVGDRSDATDIVTFFLHGAARRP